MVQPRSSFIDAKGDIGMNDSKTKASKTEATESEQNKKQAYVRPTIRSQEAYEKLALISCQIGGSQGPPFGSCTFS